MSIVKKTKAVVTLTSPPHTNKPHHGVWKVLSVCKAVMSNPISHVCFFHLPAGILSFLKGKRILNIALNIQENFY